MRDFANFQTDPWLRKRAAECCVALILGPALAWSTPFGTDEQGFLARLGFWLILLPCWLLTVAILEKLLAPVAAYRNLGSVFRGLVVVGLAPLPMLPVVGPAAHALAGWELSVAEVVELYFEIAVLGAAITLIVRAALMSRFDLSAIDGADPAEGAGLPADREETPEEGEPVATAGANRLLGRLPPNLRGPIIAVEMEDHYARVHTSKGSALVLTRLSDAIAETAPTPGRQVHRSWWVADEAIERFERVGRVGQISLSNGVVAPVSQRYLRDMEQFVDAHAQ